MTQEKGDKLAPSLPPSFYEPQTLVSRRHTQYTEWGRPENLVKQPVSQGECEIALAVETAPSYTDIRLVAKPGSDFNATKLAGVPV